MTVGDNIEFALRVRKVKRGGAPRATQGAAAARRARGHGRPPADAALGRPAAARRRGARTGAPAAGAADGRALRRARRQDPRGTAPDDPPDPARARHHDDPRHARPGRSVRAGRPDRRDAPGPPARVRPAGRSLHAAGRPASSPTFLGAANLLLGYRAPRRRALRAPRRHAASVPREVVAVLRPEEVELAADEAEVRSNFVATARSRRSCSPARSNGCACGWQADGPVPVAPGRDGSPDAGRCSRSRGRCRSSGSSRWPSVAASPSVRGACTCCRRRSPASRRWRRSAAAAQALRDRRCSPRWPRACRRESRCASGAGSRAPPGMPVVATGPGSAAAAQWQLRARRRAAAVLARRRRCCPTTCVIHTPDAGARRATVPGRREPAAPRGRGSRLPRDPAPQRPSRGSGPSTCASCWMPGPPRSPSTGSTCARSFDSVRRPTSCCASSWRTRTRMLVLGTSDPGHIDWTWLGSLLEGQPRAARADRERGAGAEQALGT